MTIPNVLTGVRLLLVPVFLALVIIDTPASRLSAVAVFITAAVTDFLDGYIARRAHQVSEFGKVADPLADRLLIVAGLIGLLIKDRLDPWVLVVLITRDVIMLWGFQYLAARDLTVPVTWPGKVTTAVLLTAFSLLLLASPAGTYVLYLGIALSVASGTHYVLVARHLVVQQRAGLNQ